MNCKSVRKFLVAFADGQLGVHTNCEVLDHLKMCPSCSAIVDEQQFLRRALARSAERVSVPAHLETSIRRAILADGKPAERPSESSPRGLRIGRALALAACLVLGITIVWNALPHLISWGGGNLAGSSTFGLSRADALTQQVVIQHNKCGVKCDMQTHHHNDLPLDRGALVSAYQRRFGGALAAVAPDFSGYGYDLDSANFCSPFSSDGVAAHVMYVNLSYGTRLSLFAVPYWSEIDSEASAKPDRNQPYVHALRDCDDNAMIAWHEDQTTIILCGRMDAEAMVEIIRDIQFTANVPVNDTSMAHMIARTARP